MAISHPSCFNYDVFLSFRGEDTRKTFTDHLYTALKQKGINTFRDDDALERGRLLKPELEKAIDQSAISLIVFSKTYASSEWCLDEVLMIVEQHKRSYSKREVVPVFYNVDPTDVRNQTGCFEEAFSAYDNIIKEEMELHKKTEWSEKVKAWRYALKKAGSLTGMVSKDGFEAQFIINIVEVIRKKLNYNALYIEDKLVGIKEDVAEIESWLQDPSPNSTVLLIHGMGGIGKTTIAKCIFNSNHGDQYDGSCFLANISETSNQPNGLLRLQSQLLSQILGSEKEEMIWSVDEGITKVIKAICRKRILLVLDDVTTSQQLDALLGTKRFYPGSKVIITTRDKSLSNSFEVHPTFHTISTLSTDDSIKLFSLHAFHQNQPTESYIVQSELVIHHCMDLPLALKVLGSYLRGKNIKEWEDARCQLEESPHPGIQKVLQMSYETLEFENDKELFLHIACFFVLEDEDYIVKLLAECKLFPVIGIKNLKDRCLVYDEYGKVGMHPLIREMGQEVVRQESPKYPGKRSRLWRHEDCINVFQEDEGTKKVEGFMLNMHRIREAKSTLSINMNNYSRKRSFEEYQGKTMHESEANFDIGALEKMKNLMLLQLNFATFYGECNSLPKKLRLLRWHGFPLKSIHGNIPLKMLIILDMSYSKLECLWDDHKFIGSLKILNLSYCDDLMKTPDFSGLPGLESLILKGCKRLRKVDESIACLTELVLLDLTDCINLREFPYLPASLVSLEMSGCPNLGVVGSFRYLESTSLPSLLNYLNISNCNLFDSSFPNDWSNLVSLKGLNINGNNIASLPKCIQSLPSLRALCAENCSQIQSIIGLPRTVYNLVLNDNESLEKVQLHQKGRIQRQMSGCPKLLEVEGYYKLKSIDKVDKIIIEKLGLGSPMELGTLDYSKQKVSYECGIFSTWVRGNQIPCCSRFMYIAKGPQISFKVAENDSRLVASFNLCLVFSEPKMSLESSECKYSIWLDIQVYNKTKDLLWTYTLEYTEKLAEREKKGWVSLWRCGSILEHGDEMFVRILNRYKHAVCMGVDECGINLVYEEDNQVVVNNQVAVSALDQLAWSDRMFTEISDCVHNGNTYEFGRYRPPGDCTKLYDGQSSYARQRRNAQ